eukprot:13196416-Alexandrium_andersonii.AAC.1
MSASLVGSEMCIRDSTAPHPPPSRTRRCVPLGECKPRSLRPSLRGERLPVSYTHLTLPTICSV